MSNIIFPSITPNFIQIEPTEFVKNSKQFNQGDYLQSIIQDTEIGLVLNLEWQKAPLVILNQVRNIYYQAKTWESFTLPSQVLKNFDSNMREILTKFPLWRFREPVKIKPFLYRENVKLYNFTCSIQNVLS